MNLCDCCHIVIRLEQIFESLKNAAVDGEVFGEKTDPLGTPL